MIAGFNESDIALLRQMAAEFRARNPSVVGEFATLQPKVLGSSSQSVKIGKADADITFGSSGSVTIWRRSSGAAPSATTETIDAHLDWLSVETISASKMVLIQYFKDETIWRIVGAECE